MCNLKLLFSIYTKLLIEHKELMPSWSAFRRSGDLRKSVQQEQGAGKKPDTKVAYCLLPTANLNTFNPQLPTRTCQLSDFEFCALDFKTQAFGFRTLYLGFRN
jgi:hypothetical protein